VIEPGTVAERRPGQGLVVRLDDGTAAGKEERHDVGTLIA
jgi:hypothetical protein